MEEKDQKTLLYYFILLFTLEFNWEVFFFFLRITKVYFYFILFYFVFKLFLK